MPLQGVKVKMDNEGNLMVKRLAKSNVYVRYATGENAVGSDILKLPQAALEANKGLAVSYAKDSVVAACRGDW